MPCQALPANAELEAAFSGLYREFFRCAEKKRRWSLNADIPWQQVNPSLSPAIADVVESFCAVELYLPDYVANAMATFRASRTWTWFYANWGYEESKHSLALGDWLLKSGQRSDEQMTDLETRVLDFRWNVPHDNAVGMLVYAMVQELATGLNYRNLRRRVDLEGDPALSQLLGFVAVDEQAHHNFFLKAVRVFLEHDRPATLRQLHRVLHNFSMPALYHMADGRQRIEAIKALGVFNDQLYFSEVYQPILATLGITRPELRRSA